MKPLRIAALTAMGVAASVALSACSSSGGGKSGSDGGSGGQEYRFGVVGSSAGPFAANNATMVAGINYAVKLINDAGGVNGAKIKTFSVDLQDNVKNGVTLVPKLVTDDKVMAIIGPVDSATCDIVCTTSNKLKVPLVSPGAGRPGVMDNARPYGFTIAQPDADNSTPVLKKILADNNVKTAAIIADEVTATTKAQQALFNAVFKDAGVTVVKTVTFSAGDTSYSAQVTSMKSAKPDIIALAAGPSDAGRIAKEVRNQGMTAKLLGTSALQSGGAAYAESGGDAVNGTYSCSQFDPTDPNEPTKGLLAKAMADNKFEQVPLNFAYAFDAVNMIVKVIKDKNIKPGDDLSKARVSIQEGLNNLGEYTGMAGKTSFKEDGTAIRPQLEAIMQNGEFAIQH